MAGPLILDRDALASLCRQFGVRRLVLFGSALTDRFDEENSDVDFLVEFGEVEDPFDAYFGFKEAVEALVGLPVDLAHPKALDNPYFAETVRRLSEELYAA